MFKYLKQNRFDRNEFSGSFGDIGTDIPLLVGMILACRLDAASVLIMFGLMQIMTGLVYGLPMPVQPLKAVAVIMIAQKLGGGILFGAGLAIGATMLILTATGLMEWCAKAIPKSVVRGIQFGLGLSLAALALKNYVPSDGLSGYALAASAFAVVLLLLGNRKYPPAVFVILLGFLYSLIFKTDFAKLSHCAGFSLPEVHLPAVPDIIRGFVILALPQIPLSFSNSIVATSRTVGDFFPGRETSVRKIGFTYSIMNLISPFFSGIPTCHGAGGMAGHYAFGARTGGSVIIYGSVYLIIGLFFSRGFEEIIKAFPLPVLGVVLLFESLALMALVRDVTDSPKNVFVALMVAVTAFTLPNGYLIGLLLGAAVVYLSGKNILLKSMP